MPFISHTPTHTHACTHTHAHTRTHIPLPSYQVHFMSCFQSWLRFQLAYIIRCPYSHTQTHTHTFLGHSNRFLPRSSARPSVSDLMKKPAMAIRNTRRENVVVRGPFVLPEGEKRRTKTADLRGTQNRLAKSFSLALHTKGLKKAENAGRWMGVILDSPQRTPPSPHTHTHTHTHTPISLTNSLMIPPS